jgi:hypothetical protein
LLSEAVGISIERSRANPKHRRYIKRFYESQERWHGIFVVPDWINSMKRIFHTQ